jgi:uncharacterized protein DUF6544
VRPELGTSLDEPVRRFLQHAIAEGAALGRGVRLTMTGRIRVGAWLPFSAEQTVDGRSFAWRARVGWGGSPRCASSTAMRGRGQHRGFACSVALRAESDDTIVARFDLPPEHPEVRVRIDERKAIRSVSALRWGNPAGKSFSHTPCGCVVHAEHRFADLVLPSSLTVGWWFGTPSYAPFFHAVIGTSATSALLGAVLSGRCRAGLPASATSTHVAILTAPSKEPKP